MKGIQPEDLFEMKWAAEPRMSPEGTQLAFAMVGLDGEKNEYTSGTWLAEISHPVSSRRLTSGEHRDGKPRWSPGGLEIAFVSHREEKGSQLYVLPLGGGEARRIASFQEEIEEVAWSPDGTRIALLVRDQNKDLYEKEKPKDQPPRHIDRLVYRLDNVGWTIDRLRQIFVVDLEGKSDPVQLTSGPYECSGLTWSPDGSQIAFVSARHDSWDIDRLTDIYLISPTGGDPECLTETDSGHSLPSWSPDGSAIAFGWNPSPLDAPRHGRIAVIDLSTRERRVLTEDLDRNSTPYFGAREPVWANGDLYFLVEDQGNQHIYRAAADGSGKPERVIGEDDQVTAFDVVGGTVAYGLTTATELPTLHVISETEKGIVLTPEVALFAKDREIVSPERFTATSRDGTEVEAWCIRPAGFDSTQKYPALLNIHGGPFTQYGNRFFDEFQVYAGAGYVVIYSNPRGSCGYSEDWGRAIRGPKIATDPGSGWGGVDYEDLMAVTDAALEKFDFIDADRLGVMGGSYGGFMTSWIIGHTNRFKAAISERAVNNHFSMCYTSDIGAVFKSYFGPLYLEDPEEYMRMSPITYVRNIETPVLILHSENDLRCPISQAEELFSALRFLGKEVEFVRFPGESHELSRSGSPRHREKRFEIILDFLDRKLRSAAG